MNNTSNNPKISDEWRTPQRLFDELNKEFNFDIDLCATKENSKCNTFCSDYLSNKTITFEHDRDDMYSGTIDWYDYKCAFMNPPYSNPKPFIEKAWEDSKHCKIVCLVKCDPSTRWWATFWDYDIECRYCQGNGDKSVMNAFSTIRMKCPFCVNGVFNAPKPGCSQPIYFPKRIKFDPPKGWLRKECEHCKGAGRFSSGNGRTKDGKINCGYCCGKGKQKLSGPTFPCALIIMDRRGL